MSVSPPRPKGPHLNALRAFESAGRLQSFISAAEELCVTPGAVSQHVKSLEAWAEGKLFVRNVRGVVLTPLGEELLPEFTQAFDQLNEAVQTLRTKSTPNKIRIATLPSIAQLWLSQKLGQLRLTAPEISVSVVAVETPPNLSREPFDVTLFFQDDPLEKGGATLFQDRIFPVCAPDIAERLKQVSDLEKETLLYDSAWMDDWTLWLESISGVALPVKRGPVHSLFSVALEEARHGAGVLMAHEALVSSYLANGILVVPFDHKLTLRRSLVMQVTPGFRTNPACHALRHALVDRSGGDLQD